MIFFLQTCPSWLILAMLILLYAAFFAWASYAQYYSLDNHYPQDMAAHSQYCWNTAHGKFLQQTILYIGGPNHLYFIFALLAPLYAAAGHIGVLFFSYSLIAGCGAIPAYLLGRRHLGGSGWGLFMAVAYLAYPGLHYLNLFDLKPYVMTLPFLLLAYYFWEKDKFGSFVLASLPVFIMTELTAVCIMMFGVMALLKKRALKWVAGPMLLGGGVLLLTHLVVVPLMSGGLSNDLARFTFDAGHFLSAFKKVLRFPGLAAFALLAAPEVAVLAAPYAVVGIFVKGLRSIHYFPMAVVLFITLPHGLVWARRWWSGTAWAKKNFMAAAAAGIALLYLFDPFMVRPHYFYSANQSAKDAWALVEQIPQQAAVSCDTLLLPALSRRARLHDFARKEYSGEKIDFLDVDYILIDPQRAHHLKKKRQQNYLGQARTLYDQALQGSSAFEIIAGQGEWVLFRRKAGA